MNRPTHPPTGSRPSRWDAIRAFYQADIVERDKEPELLVTVALLLTFGAVRLITYSIRYHWVPLFHNITAGDVHVHHMVPGMLLVLLAGYLGLAMGPERPLRVLAVLFGIGAGLVLDEFALWLRLEDVYWEPEGRQSLDAMIVALVLLVLYLLELRFWRHLVIALLGRIRHADPPPAGDPTATRRGRAA
jgi:hypothetical protein